MSTPPLNDRDTEAPPPVQDDAAETEPLAGDFAPATYAQWEELVRAKEKDPDRRLITALEEGIEVNWLYTAADAIAPDAGGLPGAAPFTRGVRTGSPWAIRQRNATADLERANAEILDELEGGATEILLDTPAATVDELDRVLDGVYLDLAPIALDGDPAVADLMLELYRRRGHDPADIRGSLRLGAIDRLAEVRAEFPRLQVLAVDTTPYVEAGAGGVLELALALATGVGYLRAADAAGIDPAELAAALEFTLAVGPDQFLEIARIRAARRLWSTVLEHSGVAPEARKSPLYVRTSRRMYSSLDPWVNMLRATTAAFAAAVGGADGITVLPFDEPDGTGLASAGPLGRRIARNTQLLLAEESSLHRVADPAGGSWYVESLTDQLAQAAWTQFQALEADGGIEPLLESGELASRFAALTEERQGQVARRRRSLTGVNQFPLLGDDGVDRSAAATSPASSAGDGGLARDAAQFEALRERAKTIDNATILLAPTGPLSAHVNVLQWAKSFFESGGVETVESGDVVAAAVCVGKDTDPSDVVAELKQRGIAQIYAVGADIDGLERVKDGVDMVAVLSGLLDRLESN